MGTGVSRWAVATLMLLALLRTAMADDKPVDLRRTIVVTGQGEVTSAPDLVIIALSVETTADKATEAVGKNAALSTKVSTALTALLDKDDKLTTTRYSLDPRYEQAKPGQTTEPHIIGYVAHNEVQVETHKLDGLGALIDAAIAAGANRVSSLQFTLSNRNQQLRAALEKAGAEARAQAESVAKALGVTLKGVLSASTSTAPIVQPRYFEGRAMAAMAASPPTPIEPGTVSVSANLQVTYEID